MRQPSALPRRRKGTVSRNLLSIFAIALLLPAAAWPQSNEAADPETSTGVAATIDPRGVAILPASVPAADPSQRGIANFINAELRRQLATINGVRLVPAATSDAYANRLLSPFEIGQALDAATLIRVTVRPGLQGILISISVRDSRSSDLKVWTSGYSRVDDIPAPINRIQHAVAAVRENVEYWGDAERQAYRDAMEEVVRPIILDDTRTDQERLHALSVLAPPRFGVGEVLRYPDGGAVLGGQVAVAAGNIAKNSDVPAVRQDIWQTMTGVGDAVILPPVLGALASDPEPSVRIAAARALSAHVNEPGVREALDTARKTDTDPDVRAMAQDVLTAPDILFDDHRATFMDVGLPSLQRLGGLSALMLIHGVNPIPVDGELLDAIAEYAATSPDPWTRVSAWQHYTSLVDSDAIGPLATALEFDESAVVRERVVMELNNFTSYPGITELITNTCNNDMSQYVRYAALRALDGNCEGGVAALWKNPTGEGADLE
jgi:TolB-like protein